MKIKNGFGAIDLLIGLLVSAVVFMVGMNALKGINFQHNPSDTKSIQEHVDTQVNEIQHMRQQTFDLQNEILKEAQ